jgi:hypothetical protein
MGFSASHDTNAHRQLRRSGQSRALVQHEEKFRDRGDENHCRDRSVSTVRPAVNSRLFFWNREKRTSEAESNSIPDELQNRTERRSVEPRSDVLKRSTLLHAPGRATALPK